MDCPFCKEPTTLVSDHLGGYYRCDGCDEEFQSPDQIQNGLGRMWREERGRLRAELAEGKRHVEHARYCEFAGTSIEFRCKECQAADRWLSRNQEER